MTQTQFCPIFNCLLSSANAGAGCVSTYPGDVNRVVGRICRGKIGEEHFCQNRDFLLVLLCTFSSQRKENCLVWHFSKRFCFLRFAPMFLGRCCFCQRVLQLIFEAQPRCSLRSFPSGEFPKNIIRESLDSRGIYS